MTISENHGSDKRGEFPAVLIQRRLIALGYDIGRNGPHRDGVDGDIGDLSQAAILQALETGKPAATAPAMAAPAIPAPKFPRAVPPVWMPDARMSRIIVHWTGGNHRPSEDDRGHYHILIDGAGGLVRGTPSIALNTLPAVRPGYAAHTRGCNSGAIGVALCCMAGAIEAPFEAGKAPMTPEQWAMLPLVLAHLCQRYAIPVTERTVLSHAEVQDTLGIAQAGKWDIAAIPALALGGMSKVNAAVAGGLFRAATRDLL